MIITASCFPSWAIASPSEFLLTSSYLCFIYEIIRTIGDFMWAQVIEVADSTRNDLKDTFAKADDSSPTYTHLDLDGVLFPAPSPPHLLIPGSKELDLCLPQASNSIGRLISADGKPGRSPHTPLASSNLRLRSKSDMLSSPVSTQDLGDPSTWRPDVPASQIFEEKTWLQGSFLSAIAYGVVVTLFFLNLSLLLERLKKDPSSWRTSSWRQQNLALIAYVGVMFVLSTLTVASQAEMTQLGFIVNRNFPGGPAAFQNIMFSIPISRIGNVCFSLMNWFANCVLLWRCIVIYKTSTLSITKVIAAPVIMLLASFGTFISSSSPQIPNHLQVTGVIYLTQISRPGSSPWATETFTLIYGLISLSLNIILTVMIVVRLYLHRRRVVRAIGARHASQYTSIIAMLIESAFVLDVVVIWFIVAFALGSPLANIPSPPSSKSRYRAFLAVWRHHHLTMMTDSGFCPCDADHCFVHDHLPRGHRTAWASSSVADSRYGDEEIANRIEISAIRFGRSGTETVTAIDGSRGSHSRAKSIDIELVPPSISQTISQNDSKV
ncbi:hypothetical protein NLJ89_g7423 [Agrocybe chaxingu]|uniref:Uncharacterized protein n=1 Tax=Agrocybe chaxingu TaxID=84603 RepID=A0A9W8JWE9_9AGAR|nr:hypothetical protein NLJ89_g7423 [Agrocybe chaxingu]